MKFLISFNKLTTERVITRINNPNGGFYKILVVTKIQFRVFPWTILKHTINTIFFEVLLNNYDLL